MHHFHKILKEVYKSVQLQDYINNDRPVQHYIYIYYQKHIILYSYYQIQAHISGI